MCSHEHIFFLSSTHKLHVSVCYILEMKLNRSVIKNCHVEDKTMTVYFLSAHRYSTMNSLYIRQYFDTYIYKI